MSRGEPSSNRRPLLSIIIPTFNASRTIARCLESIQNQTFNDLEVLIQDGGSTDNTLQIVEAFQAGIPTLELKIQQGRDRGVYDAMNQAVSRARGEWLYFLGSDDELHDEDVLRAVMCVKNASKYGVLYGDVKIIGDCEWAKNGAVYDGPFDLRKLLSRNICHQAMFYRSEVVRRVGAFNIDYRVCGDWDYNLRCWAQTTFKYVGVTVAKFYAGGISGRPNYDDQFGNDIASNVIRYFGFSLLNPLINSGSFVGQSNIIKMQNARGVVAAMSGRIVRRFLRFRETPAR
jgi:glycosyltransferase involved in cell wall biosynthesis